MGLQVSTVRLPDVLCFSPPSLTRNRLEYFDAISCALGDDGRKYRTADWALYWTSEQLLATGIMRSAMGS